MPRLLSWPYHNLHISYRQTQNKIYDYHSYRENTTNQQIVRDGLFCSCWNICICCSTHRVSWSAEKWNTFFPCVSLLFGDQWTNENSSRVALALQLSIIAIASCFSKWTGLRKRCCNVVFCDSISQKSKHASSFSLGRQLVFKLSSDEHAVSRQPTFSR